MKRDKCALHQPSIRPDFLLQLMLSCENECTLSALCTKAHTRMFPVFRVSKAMWHSEGHLAVLFYIFFHHKNAVFLCFMQCFFSNNGTARGYSSSFTGLFPKAV